MAYDDVQTLGDDPLADDSPVLVLHRHPRLAHRQNAVWRREAARAFDDLTSDIESGNWPTPTCFGEEMALHLIIQDAEEGEHDRSPHLDALVDRLPEHKDDFDWDMCSEVFFQDHDILTLFTPALDGIEDPDSDPNTSLAAGDMRPAAWFNPFNNAEPRDGRRPFRR